MKRPTLVFSLAMVVAAGVWVSSGQDLRFLRDSKRLEIKPREHDGASYYALRDVARIFSLPWQERSENEFLLRGRRGSITFFKDKAEIRVNGEMVPLRRPVWRRRREQWFVTSDFFEIALLRIIDVALIRQSASTFEIRPLPPLLDVAVHIAVFPDHARLTLEPAQPADFQIRDAGNTVEITAANRLLNAAPPATIPGQGFVSRVIFDPSGNGILRVEKGPAFQGRREQTLENPFRKVIDFYGPPPLPPTPPTLPPPGRTELPVLPPIAPLPGMGVSPSVQAKKFVPRPTQNIIVLDAGHGGPDLGAHPSTELLEKNLTIALAQQIRTEIERLSPYKVVITRQGDHAMGILQRTALANSFHAEAFVSLHFGGSYDPATRGGNVYFYTERDDDPAEHGPEPATEEETGRSRNALTHWRRAQLSMTPRSQALAARLQARLNRLFDTPDTQVISDQFLVLQGSISPAVIVEAGYLSNEEDAQFLSEARNMKRVAGAIAEGILDFLRAR
ncbi:MAG: N-acetylmuramoyl-L-alanine amidase [Acidobacteria bacterium]|nr:N-acetylmuramoyl-L-alanine amidase [Acidobacteriota bacterium]